jgi:hypothetical protein
MKKGREVLGMSVMRNETGQSAAVKCRGVWASGLLGLVLLGSTGCIQEYVDDQLVLGPRTVELDTTELSPTLLAERIREIDESYAEPRTPARVALSLETSLISISPVNDYEALWRGMRACAWLARHYPLSSGGGLVSLGSSSSMRREFALRGVALGQQARAKISNRVESFYYLGQCQLALLEQGLNIARPTIREAQEHLKIAIALDAEFDHCGPRRALGEVLLAASERTFLHKGVGDAYVREAVDHLRAAANGCPDYAKNRLALARASIKRHDYETARANLEEVLVSQTPVDYASDHERWLEEANELLIDLQGK